MTDANAAVSAQSLEPLINALAVSFTAVSTASVVLRVFTRRRILKIIGADDELICVAQILSIGVMVATILQARWGLGRHTWTVSAEDSMRQLKSLYVVTILYNFAQIVVKISFLILYRRLFPTRRMQFVCFWFLVFIIVWGIAQEMLIALCCMPLSLFETHMTGHCLPSLPVWYSTTSMNVVTDFIIFMIPIFPVLKLQMRLQQKLLLSGLFCLGFFVCIVSIIRITTLHKAVRTTDPLWDNAPAAYWTVIELNCGILCACLPTLRPLIQRILPHVFSTRSHSYRTGPSNQFSRIHTKSGADIQDGIYVRKDVNVEIEMHSTTELNKNTASRSSSDDGKGHETVITSHSH